MQALYRRMSTQTRSVSVLIEMSPFFVYWFLIIIFIIIYPKIFVKLCMIDLQLCILSTCILDFPSHTLFMSNLCTIIKLLWLLLQFHSYEFPLISFPLTQFLFRNFPTIILLFSLYQIFNSRWLCCVLRYRFHKLACVCSKRLFMVASSLRNQQINFPRVQLHNEVHTLSETCRECLANPLPRFLFCVRWLFDFDASM